MAEQQLALQNRLGCSASLYLRQHAGNPVHWQPWDDAAFEAARAGDRPILLSIGYAACHWCHVMARESFADPATAALMNELFVCIKVDREERPDLDRHYLGAMAGLGKATGWPLTAFLAPDATVFHGGGYFPPVPRFGLPAFGDVLRETAAGYRSGRHTPAPAPAMGPQRGRAIGGAVPDSLLDRVSRALGDGVDELYGGFGTDGPKFLHAAGHELLLRSWHRTGDDGMLETAAGSVAQMSSGAVFDHVGGGYYRYAVDDRWQVPHFEKMLNDNALMARLDTQLWQATGATLFAARVRATLDWLLRDMRLPGGGFASSLAADSGGVEGGYYLWDLAELRRVLGDRGPAFLAAFTPVADERLSEQALIRNTADGRWNDDGAFDAALAALRAARSERAPPLRDDKCLADWNGLAITALAEAGMAFARSDWTDAARAAFDAVLASLGMAAGLAHCSANGVCSAAGLLDDYAAMAQAALALFEASGDPRYLDRALGWERELEARFWDQEDGGYCLTATGAERRIPRQNLIDETASPAGNATMLAVLARLQAATGRERFRHRFDGILRRFGGQMPRAGLQAATALCNSQAADRLVQIVLVGDADHVLRRAVTSRFVPDRLILSVPRDADLPHGHPAFGKTAPAGAAAAYVCFGQSCLPPAFDAASLAESLSIAARRLP